MNLVVIKGNLTGDPRLKTVEYDGTSSDVVNFSVAVNRRYKRKDGTKVSDVTYVDCEAWDSGARILAEYLSKGSPILIHGTLKADPWEKDGVKFNKLKVRVTNFEFLSRGEGKSQPENEDADETLMTTASADADSGEGIPF